MSRVRRWHVLFVLVLAGVLLLALVPAQSMTLSAGSDLANHVFAFFVLGMLARLGWPARGWLLFGILLVFGAGIEIAQHFVGRDAAWMDWLADAVGLLLATVLWYMLPPRWRVAASRD